MSSMKKTLLFFIAVIFISCLISIVYKNEEKLPNTLVVGLESGYPPFEFIDFSGRLTGFDVELAQVIAQNLNKELIIQDMEFDSEEYLKENYPNIPLKSFENALACLMDVKFGKSTASLLETDVGTYLKNEHPEVELLIHPLDEHKKVFGFGIGVKKGSLSLSNEVTSVIEELKANGELQTLSDKWFHHD